MASHNIPARRRTSMPVLLVNWLCGLISIAGRLVAALTWLVLALTYLVRASTALVLSLVGLCAAIHLLVAIR